jgi:hypothetical protein
MTAAKSLLPAIDRSIPGRYTENREALPQSGSSLFYNDRYKVLDVTLQL